MHRRLKRELLIWLCWSIPAAMIISLTAHEYGNLNWRSIIVNCVPWYFWAVFTTPIIAHAQKYPPETLRRIRGIARHIITGLILGITCGHIAVLMVYAFDFEPGTRSFHKIYLNGLFFWTFFGMIFYALITAVGFVLGGQQRLREREVQATQLQARLVEAQLQGLRMQLQPHFLFNTLNTVAMYVRGGDAATSIRVLTRLSELLRRVLDTGQEQEVPLEMEVEHTKRYLEIEALRFSDRLTVEFDVPADLDDALVPNLALQPLVENAIRHGIAKRGDEGAIRVRVYRDGDELVLQVYNDGPGLPADWQMQNAEGIGLRNTVLRLQHLYGENGRLSVTNTAGGVTSEMRVPLRRASATAHA